MLILKILSTITIKNITDRFTIKILFLSILTVISYSIALWLILFHTYNDHIQGELVKIIYIHVPSAWLSMLFFIFLGIFSILYILTKNITYDVIAFSISEIAIFLTICALITGSIWGKPTWGTWWVWDARLTAMFIQFFILLSYILLRYNLEGSLQNKANNMDIMSKQKVATISGILAIFGLINIPVIKFSVNMWNTLHQPSTFNSMFVLQAPKIDGIMLYPMPFMLIGLLSFSLLMILIRIRSIQINKKKYRYELMNENQ